MPTKHAHGSLGRHRIRDSIERNILSGKLKPGERLVQLDLAKEFGVAQSVIRESLLELRLSGLVHCVDNSGMFVSDLNSQRLISAYQIREVFEGLAARLCCDHATRVDIREMYALADKTYEYGKSKDLSKKSASDRRFHFRIAMASGNEVLTYLTESYRALGMVIRTDRPVKTVYEEHRSIVKAIEDNDPEAAESRARAHARAARELIESKVADGTFVPNWVLPGKVDTP